jgi:RNA polymerase sigma-70 factor (ECF subfamily)
VDTSNPHEELQALYERHGDQVWALAYARLGNAHTAWDIKQETFLRLWNELVDGEVILNPLAWLLLVARNLAVDHGKSAFHRNGTSPPQAMNDVRGNEQSPLEAAAHNEDLARLLDELATLPEMDQEILMLQASGWSCEELGVLFDRTPKAIRNKLSRARRQLRDRLR